MATMATMATLTPLAALAALSALSLAVVAAAERNVWHERLRDLAWRERRRSTLGAPQQAGKKMTVDEGARLLS